MCAMVTTKNNTFVLDLRLVSAVLLIVIVGMVIAWKPWHAKATGSRTISVSGEATISAKPDEFVFTPSYDFKSSDKSAALAKLSTKSDQLIAKLKALGVPDSKIKSNSSGYDGQYYPAYYSASSEQTTYSLLLTVTVDSAATAQKVQNYLLTTSPTGSVSPQANFSTSLRKQLESKARDEATKEARAKADQSAKNLGFKVGRVKSVSDGTGFDQAYPVAMAAEDVAATSGASPKLSVQPGENDLRYTVSVVYFIH
jgi:uncharacterized protein YggE